MWHENHHWACKKCGRIFERRQISEQREPTCFACGPTFRLTPWLEFPNWVFFGIGVAGFPLAGRIIVALIEGTALDASYPHARLVGFCALPAVIAFVNVFNLRLGRRTGNQWIRRSGEQGMLQATGFALVLFALIATGYLREVAGLR